MDEALPMKLPRDARGVFVSVRLSKSEKRAMAEAARRDGMAPATWIRMVALREARRVAAEGQP